MPSSAQLPLTRRITTREDCPATTVLEFKETLHNCPPQNRQLHRHQEAPGDLGQSHGPRSQPLCLSRRLHGHGGPPVRDRDPQLQHPPNQTRKPCREEGLQNMHMPYLGCSRQPNNKETSSYRWPSPKGREILGCQTLRPMQHLSGYWTPLAAAQRHPDVPPLLPRAQNQRTHCATSRGKKCPHTVFRCANCDANHHASDRTCPTTIQL